MARALALSAKEAGGEVDPKEDDDVKQHAGLFSMMEELESMQRQTAAHRHKSYRASADGAIERIESAELNEAEVSADHTFVQLSHFLYFRSSIFCTSACASSETSVSCFSQQKTSSALMSIWQTQTPNLVARM